MLKVLLVLKDLWENKALKVYREHKEHQEFKELLEKLVLKVQLVLKDL